MIIATAGHVDHGKTTLIRTLTGVDTDRLIEEKQRGMSIDLGFAYADLAGMRIGFIDVPGHERFIRNMLAGIAGIDFALLVVAADDGVMPQTREHLAILDLLGISHGAVAISKIDRADRATVSKVTQQLAVLLQETSLSGIPFIPVSAQTGAGITDLRNILATAAAAYTAQKPEGNFRLAIDRVFSLRGIGVTVTGTVFSGEAGTGDLLMLSPSGIHVRARSIHANDQAAEKALRGQRCAINIAAASGDTLDRHAIRRGEWLLAADAHAPTTRIDARVRVLAGEAGPLEHWQAVHVHSAAAHVPARLALLEGSKPAPGATGLVQLVLDRPIGALHGDRVILRDAGAKRTIGGGVVIDPFAPGKGRTQSGRIAVLHAFEKSSRAAALEHHLAISPGGIDLRQFLQTFNQTEAEAETLAAQVKLVRFGRGSELTAMSEAHYAALCASIPVALANWHREHPQSLGPNAPELLRTLQPLVSTLPFTAALNALLQAQTIIRKAALLHPPGHAITLNAEDRRMWENLCPVFEGAGLIPPRIRELAERFSQDPKEIEALLTRIAQAGLLSKVSANRFFMPETLRRLAGFAEDLVTASGAPFSAKDYRIRSGIGRNLTIELLEYFDRALFTRRIGAGRVLRCRAEDIFGR